MNWARAFFGTLVVAVGVILMLDAANVADSDVVFAMWWPLVLLVAGAMAFAANPRHWLVPLVLVVVGGVAFLDTTNLVDADVWEFVGPALVIVVGATLIFSRTRPVVHAEDRIRTFNLFSGSEIASHSRHFEGGTIGAMFGGAEVDLRDAVLAPGASIDVFTAFGGAEIKVPEGWKVITHGFPIFGGFDNVTAKERIPENAPVLDVSATVLFGGLEVKH
jgi:hypothetical protein